MEIATSAAHFCTILNCEQHIQSRLQTRLREAPAAPMYHVHLNWTLLLVNIRNVLAGTTVVFRIYWQIHAFRELMTPTIISSHP